MAYCAEGLMAGGAIRHDARKMRHGYCALRLPSIECRYKRLPSAALTRTRNVLRTPQEKPRPAARSLQGDRGAASDRLDHHDEPQGRDQSRALFVLQRPVG